MPTINNESVLWYKVGMFGDAGYAVPNWGLSEGSENQTIFNFVDVTQRNLFAFMHSTDADSRVPPTINSLLAIHRLVLRARQILAGRAVAPGTPRMTVNKAAPAPEEWRVYPTPFFCVRNSWLKTYAGLVFTAISEAMQHTENHNAFDISTDFAGQIGQYFTRLYQMMAIELLMVDPATAQAPGFVLTDAQLAAYNPSKWFTQTEMVDNVPPIAQQFTSAQLDSLGQGILISDLPNLGPYPSYIVQNIGLGGGDASGNPTNVPGVTAAAAANSPAIGPTVPPFPAAPGSLAPTAAPSA